ncbi:uncharacterized protein BDR25DRAFT_313253 [Lindgomyces ingoldianus]|uniref:Uncharacterized protein n=1 Tax=Lindgomyces ingoldianus TaxID=673940 RepID=A0ACB6QYH7_9PLEO|nr:uncharacterized protein BDR25DRAFT_313253 [Lindgomyces ingoldianus]KAF2472048.1 hypothetical protein BDR25DRAFT_313253 [Lindgomyces ingoldianus]
MSSPFGNSRNPFSRRQHSTTPSHFESLQDGSPGHDDDYSLPSYDYTEDSSQPNRPESTPGYRKPTEASKKKRRSDIVPRSGRGGEPMFHSTPDSISPKGPWKPAGKAAPHSDLHNPLGFRRSSTSVSSLAGKPNAGFRTPTTSSYGSLTPSSTPTRKRSFNLPLMAVLPRIERRRSGLNQSPLAASADDVTNIDRSKLGRLSAEMSGIRLKRPDRRLSMSVDSETMRETLKWRESQRSYHGMNSPPPELADVMNGNGYGSPSNEVEGYGYYDVQHKRLSQPTYQLNDTNADSEEEGDERNPPQTVHMNHQSASDSPSSNNAVASPTLFPSALPSTPDIILPRLSFEHRRTHSLRENPYVQKLSEEVSSLKATLASKSQALFDQEAKHQEEIAILSSKLSPSPSPNPLTASETAPSWQTLYHQKCLDNAKLVSDMKDLRIELEKNYRPKLKRENERLQKDIWDARDFASLLEQTVQTFQSQAQTWEAEYKALESRSKISSAQKDSRIAELEAEMSGVIAEYYRNVGHEQKDEVLYLRTKIQGLGHTLDGLLRENKKVATERDEWGKAVKAMMERGERLPSGYTAPRPFSFTTRKPNFESEAEIAERNEYLAQVRETQEAKREREDALCDLLEKARRFKMGDRYPPIWKGFEEVRRMEEWERWEVERYLEVAPMEDRLAAESVSKEFRERNRVSE